MPSQGGFVWAKPDLKRLSGDGANASCHIPPFDSIVDHLFGDDREHADRDGEHHVVEVDAAAQHPGLRVGAVGPVGFQRMPPVRRDLAVGKLVGQRSAGKHRQPAHRGQRLVGSESVSEADLSAHRDRVDRQTLIIEMQRVETVKEFELDTTLPQRLVHRGDDDVAHAGGHLPEDRALVLEQRQSGQEDRLPRTE